MAKRALSTVAAAAISSGCGSRPAAWLLKSEPADYSIAMMERDTTTQWDGVRNPVARKNMRAMKAGDRCFFYHSSCSKVGIVGVVSVCKEAYPDPSDAKWACVDVKHEETWGEILPLEALKSPHDSVDGMTLFRQPRLSVSRSPKRPNSLSSWHLNPRLQTAARKVKEARDRAPNDGV